MIVLSNMVTPRIEREAESRNYGKYTIGPLERGYGNTLGNALRRVLLSSLERLRERLGITGGAGIPSTINP